MRRRRGAGARVSGECRRRKMCRLPDASHYHQLELPLLLRRARRRRPLLQCAAPSPVGHRRARHGGFPPKSKSPKVASWYFPAGTAAAHDATLADPRFRTRLSPPSSPTPLLALPHDSRRPDTARSAPLSLRLLPSISLHSLPNPMWHADGKRTESSSVAASPAARPRNLRFSDWPRLRSPADVHHPSSIMPPESVLPSPPPPHTPALDSRQRGTSPRQTSCLSRRVDPVGVRAELVAMSLARGLLALSDPAACAPPLTTPKTLPGPSPPEAPPALPRPPSAVRRQTCAAA
ncbi:hypothetical protein B0H13DRAFT_2655930 [Mycena leptocephala]|nr:hypothetical protein B0H13DRAFT_2655930 [Mycena leptocephala]